MRLTVVQITSSLNVILLANSLLALVLILNQNESSKELTANSNSTSTSNPLEKVTWGSLFFQLFLLLIKTKTTDFQKKISCFFNFSNISSGQKGFYIFQQKRNQQTKRKQLLFIHLSFTFLRMNSNIKIFLLCPVPEEQKPINAYIGLKENQLTNWTTLSKKNYEKKLISLFSFFFFVVSFFRFSSFSDTRYVFDWFLITFSLSLTLLFFLILLIFFRWKQIEKDFNQPRLFYEEASWYDGQIWEKPFSILKNDKLISTQKIKPILQRISRTMFTLLSWNLGFFLLLKIE